MLRYQSLARLSASESAASNRLPTLQISQKRYRRIMAYPSYSNPGNIPESNTKKPVTRRLMNQFLGRKNYKGIYFQSKYAYPRKDHTPNYIDPESEGGFALLTSMNTSSKGKKLVTEDEQDLNDIKISGLKLEENELDKENKNEGEEGEEESGLSYDIEGNGEEEEQISANTQQMRDPLQPFPENPSCITNTIISKKMKEEIIELCSNDYKAIPRVAADLGLKIQRVEAIVRLGEIEQKWREEERITHELSKMSEVMYKMFPLYEPKEFAENLTEIPIPKEASQSKFITIAESEPFGPIDAANALGLEPAIETLKKLSKIGGDENSKDSKNSSKNNKIKKFQVSIKEDSDIKLQFTDVKVGQVGYRYGKSFGDTKKSRKIGYDANGRMTYLI